MKAIKLVRLQFLVVVAKYIYIIFSTCAVRKIVCIYMSTEVRGSQYIA